MSCLFLNSGLEIPINFCVSRDLQTDYLIYQRNNAPYNAYRVYHTCSPKSLFRRHISWDIQKFVNMRRIYSQYTYAIIRRKDRGTQMVPPTD